MAHRFGNVVLVPVPESSSLAGVPGVTVGGPPLMANAMVNQPLGTGVDDVILSQSACAPALIGKVAAGLETVGIPEASVAGDADHPSVVVAAPFGVVTVGV